MTAEDLKPDIYIDVEILNELETPISWAQPILKKEKAKERVSKMPTLFPESFFSSREIGQ